MKSHRWLPVAVETSGSRNDSMPSLFANREAGARLSADIPTRYHLVKPILKLL